MSKKIVKQFAATLIAADSSRPVAFRLPLSYCAKLAAVADAQGISQGAFIREAVQKAVEKALK